MASRKYGDRQENDYLPARLEGYRAVEDGFELLESGLVDIPHLVGIHETRVAHHVAAVGQVYRQNRPPAVPDGGRAVPMDSTIVRRAEIPAEKQALDPAGEIRVGGEDLLKRTVLLAHLAHEDAAVLFDQLGFDFPGMDLGERGKVGIAVEDRIADLGHALRAERIGHPRESERRRSPLVTLQDPARGPFWMWEFALRESPVDGLECLPGNIGKR
jgi:hypothetical protein